MKNTLTTNAALAQRVNNGYEERIKVIFKEVKTLSVVASFVTVRFCNTRSGVRMAYVRLFTSGARAHKEIKLPLNQELFDALLSICCGQEPSEISDYNLDDWKAEEGENFSFEVFKLLHENGFRICFGNDVLKEDAVHVPARITMSGKYVIEFYLTLNDEVRDYLETNKLR